MSILIKKNKASLHRSLNLYFNDLYIGSVKEIQHFFFSERTTLDWRLFSANGKCVVDFFGFKKKLEYKTDEELFNFLKSDYFLKKLINLNKFKEPVLINVISNNKPYFFNIVKEKLDSAEKILDHSDFIFDKDDALQFNRSFIKDSQENFRYFSNNNDERFLSLKIIELSE